MQKSRGSRRCCCRTFHRKAHSARLPALLDQPLQHWLVLCLTLLSLARLLSLPPPILSCFLLHSNFWSKLTNYFLWDTFPVPLDLDVLLHAATSPVFPSHDLQESLLQLVFCFCLFVLGCTCGIQKFPGQGLNSHLSSDLSGRSPILET